MQRRLTRRAWGTLTKLGRVAKLVKVRCRSEPWCWWWPISLSLGGRAVEIMPHHAAGTCDSPGPAQALTHHCPSSDLCQLLIQLKHPLPECIELFDVLFRWVEITFRLIELEHRRLGSPGVDPVSSSWQHIFGQLPASSRYAFRPWTAAISSSSTVI
jgi:hypothetical protein